MSVSAHIYRRLVDLLEESRVVVWYDGEGTMRALAMQFTAPHCQLVDTSESTLKSRREADRIFRGLNDPDNATLKNQNLLIYCPRRRGRTRSAVKTCLRCLLFSVRSLAIRKASHCNHWRDRPCQSALPTSTGCLQKAIRRCRCSTIYKPASHFRCCKTAWALMHRRTSLRRCYACKEPWQRLPKRLE
jgi:hypothetical protein